MMDIVIDTSAIIAVIVDEPERERIIELTRGNTLIGPGSILWEIGNAFSTMFERESGVLKKLKEVLKYSIKYFFGISVQLQVFP